MELEPNIQSEVSQKGKTTKTNKQTNKQTKKKTHQYSILTHVYGI